MPDLEIVRLLKLKNTNGLHRLLEKYAGQVQWTLQRELGGLLETSDLEAALNQAAYQAWRHVDTYREERGELGAWFYVIARNAALALAKADTLRRHQQIREDVDLDAWRAVGGTVLGHGSSSVQAASGSEQPDSPPTQSRYIVCLRECVQKLPGLQRQIILADLQSNNVAEAGELARMFKTSKNSIYVSRSNARKSLKRAMQRHGFFGGDSGHEEEKRA